MQQQERCIWTWCKWMEQRWSCRYLGLKAKKKAKAGSRKKCKNRSHYKLSLGFKSDLSDEDKQAEIEKVQEALKNSNVQGGGRGGAKKRTTGNRNLKKFQRNMMLKIWLINYASTSIFKTG